MLNWLNVKVVEVELSCNSNAFCNFIHSKEASPQLPGVMNTVKKEKCGDN